MEMYQLINQRYYLQLQLHWYHYIYVTLNIPVGKFGKKLQPLSDKLKSTLRNRLSDLKVKIIDEISMVSNDLAFHIHLRLNEYFVLSTTNHFQAYQ